MGCGGYGRIFDLFESCGSSRNGCRWYRESYSHGYRDDVEDAMILLKRIYAEGIVGDNEYEIYRQSILNGNAGFEQIRALKMTRSNNNYNSVKEKNNDSKVSDAYKEKISILKQSKVKVDEVQNRLSERIEELNLEKEKMERMADEMLKSSEAKAEEYIRKKLDVLENIQNLEKRRNELQVQMQEINNNIKIMETKELEEEAKRLKEELSKMNIQDSFMKE
jgi:DNA repair exonuclease SbcCD ATPase subunit